jgi:hypothetical protein
MSQKYNYQTYYRLRKMLDSFESMALAYCLESKDDSEAQAKFNEIEQDFRKPINDLRDKLIKLNGVSAESAVFGEGNQCPPDAPYRCDNDCVPYPCP